MILVFLCVWASIVFFVLLIKMKYYWLSPPYVAFLPFVAGGVLAGECALYQNSYLSRETSLWDGAASPVEQFAFFLLGPGATP